MKIQVAWGNTDAQHHVELTVPEGATVAQALELFALQGGAQGHPEAVGVWGKARPMSHPLREGDRVELYRPLVADPKTARRKRQTRQRLQP